MSLSLFSLNARGLKNNIKRKALFLFSKRHKVDFCFFQESHSTSKDAKFWRTQWGNDIWLSHGSEHSAGVAIMKYNFNGNVLETDIDPSGHFLLIIIVVNQCIVIIVNIYGYNSVADNCAFFNMLDQKLSVAIKKYPTAFIILGGDFNIVMNNMLDRYPPRKAASPSSYLLALIDKFDLVDIWREMYPDIIQYTWSNKDHSRQSRIDYWLISKTLKDNNISTSISNSPLTDHNAIYIFINLSQSTTINNNKSLIWKLNNSLLKYEKAKQQVEEIIHIYWEKAKSQKAYGRNWELLKYELGKFFRKFGGDIAKQNRLNEDKILSQLSDFSFNKSLTDAQNAEYLKLQNKLDELYKTKAKGAYVRSRKTWLEEGEQNSAYFFRMERSNALNASIVRLRANDKLLENPGEIAHFCSQFYNNLYTSKYCDNSANLFFESINQNKVISLEDKEACEGDLSLSEILQAIKSLKNNKSPGSDGLTAELYKMFDKELSPFLLKVFEESFDLEALPPTMTQGVITLIPKPNKDKECLENWRPITLLNNDYKILASILARRIKDVLNSIIDESQSGFMEKRHITNNIRLVLDLLDYEDLIPNDSFLLFLDFYKAFDSLEHKFIFKALDKFGFGDYFCRAIRTLYKNNNSCIKLKFGTSPRFSLSRGVRQGCPISPYLFLLASQLLALHISSSNLQGITIDDRQIIISQLADDTTLFLNDASQIPHALKLIESFSKASGLYLNIKKCELMAIKNCNVPIICNIPVKDQITYLGIVINKDQKTRCKLNFDPLILKTQKKLNSWLQRDLSIRGRILLSKAEGLSRLTYAALSLEVNKETLKRIDSMLNKFVWKNKIHLIKKSVIMNPIKQGGLNYLDFTTLNNTFKINWLKNFLKNPHSLWNIIPNYIFSKVGGLNFLLLCNYNVLKIPIKLSNFHKQMLLAWSLIYKHNFSPHRYYLWNNKDILYKNKSLYFENWFKNNFLLVGQLFNSEGRLYNYPDFLQKFNIPATPSEYAIVVNSIPSGVFILMQGVTLPWPHTHSLNLIDTMVGSVCFSADQQKNNCKIRGLFQREIITIPYVIPYWNNTIENIPWEKVWTLPHKYLITNKVKEVTFKLIHKCYPTKVCLQKYKPDIDLNCSFCHSSEEDSIHLFWQCSFTERFWSDLLIFIQSYIMGDFSFSFKVIFFGLFDDLKENMEKVYVVNLCILLAKFHIHKQKFSGSKPFFDLFKIDLDQYLETIQHSFHPKATKTVSLYSSFVSL